MTSAAIAAATALSYLAGWIIGVPALVPVLNTAASFPFMVAALRRGELRVAVVRMLVWALAMAACATLLAYAQPWRAGRTFVRGDAYRTEMFSWIMTGRGAESTPAQFIPQHLTYAGAFAALAFTTGGVLAMPLGAVLMNYMGTYVGSLAAASAHPFATAIAGWHPWAIIRVISFVVLGVTLSAPLLARALRFRVDRRQMRILLVWSCVGLAADIGLKTLLAPAWQRLLLRLAGW